MRLLLAVTILALDFWAIFSVLGSRSAGFRKLLWTAGIMLFPVVGFLAWLLAGPKPAPQG
ncbi:MAG: PLDc_N domain-containing protein [Gemmatimonadetes bacterium]|nr:PLDc_N domain-containing protein [Gemmatimonadota bacterium]